MLTRRPSDVIVAIGGNFTLQCGSSLTSVKWISPNNTQIFTGTAVADSRFSVPPATRYDLFTKTAVDSSFCGDYTCSDDTQNATATVLVLGEKLAVLFYFSYTPHVQHVQIFN